MTRECGSCTKCCEGFLPGTVNNIPFYKGRPCHFVSIGKGCSIYSERPTDPCKTYECKWLTDFSVPEWMAPELSNVILDHRETNGIHYLQLHEAGIIDARTISWFFGYGVSNNINISWFIEGGRHWFGSSEFNSAMALLVQGETIK